MAMTAGKAWAVFLGGITVYEVLAAEGELLTDGVRKARAKNELAKVVVTAGIVCTAGHLLDLWGKADPFRVLSLIRF